ncbi:uncharacterized protein K02A2.6-like [Octopus sinensis]|uniref:Uncharacterized protein K02A2.6-like n=1 Tax=Octopus sinensis TaxID=2607531 RepID=A0A6P7U3N2_9MOLL|nr:uncharacterized protein K02A2.6-like [Octopus sinensis]
MEKKEIITKVTRPTDWVNSIVIKEKPNGTLRICLDPRDLNKALKRKYHPIPTLEEITPSLAGSKIFSKLDASNGYWNIKIDKESSKLTTFNTPFGRYRFNRLPFGLKRELSQTPLKSKPSEILKILDKKEIRSFLGLIHYMGAFIPKLADHTANLRELNKDDVEFDWCASHTQDFKAIKKLISKETTLQYYDRRKPVTLQVDASMRGVGAALIQEGKPIAYASKALSPTETRYANIEMNSWQ